MSNMTADTANYFLKLRMFCKVLIRVCFIILVIQLLVIYVYNSWFNPTINTTSYIFKLGLVTAWQFARVGNLNTAAEVFKNMLHLLWEEQALIVTLSFLVWAILPLALLYLQLFSKITKAQNNYIQGARHIFPYELNKIAHHKNMFDMFDIFWKLRLNHCIQFGRVRLPISEEIKQCFMVGKPGSGKTNAFNHAIDKLRKRQQKMIVHDYKGDYVEKFYNPNTDILFNPLDQRSAGWCLFNDCQSVMDIEGFAASLIPEALPGKDPYWNNAARDVMVGVLRYCYTNNKRTNQDIWNTCILPTVQLYHLLHNTKGGERGAKHIEDSSSTATANIMSGLMQYIKVFEYMAPMHGDFSITQWIEDKQTTSIIFVTNYERLQHTLNPMISLFIQTAGSVLLSQSDDLNNRVFFFLDEFGQLQNMSTIKTLMTASRSKGGSVFIGVQDIGQIDKIYQHETRSTILNSASNRIIFNCKDHETAKFFSKDIGETEYYEVVETQSLAMSGGDRITTSKQRRKEPLVTPEDIQSLPDLACFVSIGHYNITFTKFQYKLFPKISEAFVQRPELDLTYITDANLDIPTPAPTPKPSKNKQTKKEENTTTLTTLTTASESLLVTELSELANVITPEDKALVVSSDNMTGGL